MPPSVFLCCALSCMFTHLFVQTGFLELPSPYYEESQNKCFNSSHVADNDHHARILLSTKDELTSAPLPHHGELTFTLHASTLSPLVDHSVLIAALIMIFVTSSS